MSVGRFYHPVVNPFAVPSRRNYSSALQIGQVPRDFWLIDLQYFDEETNANFVVTHQIYEPQTSAIREGFEE